MKIFEFHFNPPHQDEVMAGQAKAVFDSFCYEPENIYEKGLGGLYIVGLLKNPLPQNAKLLDRLSQLIKEKYYTPSFEKRPEKSLTESLKRVNEFLAEEIKKENVSWLGNLSLAVLALISSQKPLGHFTLYFTRVGEIQIFLIRGNQIIDIGSQLEFQELEPYPLKVFSNIAFGTLVEGDQILILTKEISDFFAKPTISEKGKFQENGENLFERITNLSPLDGEKLRKIFKEKGGLLSKISGVCLLISLTKEVAPLKKEVIFPPEKEFSFREVVGIILKNLALVLQVIIHPGKELVQKINQIIISPKREPERKLKLKFPKLKITMGPKFHLNKTWTLNAIYQEKFRENLIIILLLIFFLIIGFFIFQKEEKQKLEKYQNQLKQFQEKVAQAENLLTIEKVSPEAEKKANLLLKESWQGILSLMKEDSSLPPDFLKESLDLKDKIEKRLFQINKLEKIENPQPFFEFTKEEFIPQKIIFFKKDLYCFNQFSQNLFRLNQETKETTILRLPNKPYLGVSFNDSILLFGKPDQLTILKNGEIFTLSLEKPYPDFSFDALSVFKKNLYFLDKKRGKIIKYPYLKDFQWQPAQILLSPQIKRIPESQAITVDGSVWILNADNSISQYYLGNLQKTIRLDIFPPLRKFSKILISGKHLFILEPEQNRIIIIDKSGKIIKQFQSDQFDNLLDFDLSDDGKIIWILNDSKLYQIKNEPLNMERF